MLDFQCMFGHWDCSYSWHLASCTVWAACCNVSQDLGKRCQSKFALQLNEIPAAYAGWFMKSLGEKLWPGISFSTSFLELRDRNLKNPKNWRILALQDSHTLSDSPKIDGQKSANRVAGWHPWEAPGVCLGFRVSFPWGFWWLYGEQQCISFLRPPTQKKKEKATISSCLNKQSGNMLQQLKTYVQHVASTKVGA